LYTFSPLSHACHMPCPPHLPRLGMPNICGRVQIMKLLAVQLSPLSCYLIPLRTVFSNTLSLRSSLNVIKI
jgi:hypothetical protein